MRGVDLTTFAFDYDLTWAAFFLNADETIYGRFGGRDAESPDKYLTLPGLKYAMRQALERHRRGERPPVPAAQPTPQRVEQYPAAKRLKSDACIHCHQVWDFRREEMQSAGTWHRDEVWVYPLPEGLGLSVDPDQGNRVKTIQDGSPASKAGLRPGDVLRTVHETRIASFADLQYALHQAPTTGKLAVAWERRGSVQIGVIDLPAGWRKSDISWRGSMWGLDPQPSVYGKDLTPEEKKNLGLPEKALAFRQGSFVPPAAREAGIRAGDIILGFEGKSLSMTMLQFNAWVRLTYQPGDRIVFEVIRNGERLKLPMTLPGRRT